MAEASVSGGSDRAAGDRVTTHDVETDIITMKVKLRGLTNGLISTSYRCTTCCRFSTEHRDGNVKGCRMRKSEEEEYQLSLVHEQAELRRHLDLIESSVNSAQAADWAENKLELQKKLMEQKDDELKRMRESVVGANGSAQRLSDSFTMLNASRAHDARCVQRFLDSFRKFMNDESSSDAAVEREYLALSERVQRMQVRMEPGGLDLIDIEDVGVATSDVGLRPKSVPPPRLASDDNPAYHTEFEDSEEEEAPVVRPPTVIDLPNASELRATPRHTLPSTPAETRVKLPLHNSTIRVVTPSTSIHAPPPLPLSSTRPPRLSAFSTPPPVGGAGVSGLPAPSPLRAPHPAAAVVLGNSSGDPDSVFPGIKETRKALKHEVEGEVCGGVGSNDTAKSFAKTWKGGQFQRKDTAAEYRRKKQSLIDHFSIFYGDSTIYTCVMVFYSLAMDYTTVLRELVKKKEKYTSFVHFLKCFEAEARPQLQQDAEAELQSCAQADKEDIATYFNRFNELLQLTNRRPEDCVWMWIDGIKNGETRRIVQSRPPGADPMTLDEAWKHAAHVEANFQLSKARRQIQPAGKKENVSNINDVASKGKGGGNGGSARGGGGGGRREGGAWKKENGGGAKGGGRGGGGKEGGAWKKENGGGESGRKDGKQGGAAGNDVGMLEAGGYERRSKKWHKSKANVLSVSWNATHPRYASENAQYWTEYLLGNLPVGFAKNRCLGCLDTGHGFDLQFSRCSRTECPFCGTPTFSEDGHAASDCSNLPDSAGSILAILKDPKK